MTVLFGILMFAFVDFMMVQVESVGNRNANPAPEE
jgi:hypothetical protein